MVTTEIDNLDRRILDLLQREFPIASQPFVILGHKLGLTEDETLMRISNLRKKGFIRQISAIFDTKQLGYDSCLVAIQLPPERLDESAAVISAHPGVSHNYSRSHLFNLWFTIATPPGEELADAVRKLTDRAGAVATLLFPALRTFKLCVKLDVTGSKDPTSTDKEVNSPQHLIQETALPPLAGIEIASIRELQEDLPIKKRPFQDMAKRLGMTEDDLFVIASNFINHGRMRRFAAVLRHREVGFKANAMGVWTVPSQDVERAGRGFAAFQAVSHCYERPSYPPAWPFNILTMVHAQTKEGCINILRAMSEKVGIMEYDYLFSEKEYKKARVRYFDGP